jgi:hypothetical protein
VTLLATIDRLAEQLEQTGHKALAAVLDTVSQELDERTAENQDEDAEAVTASTHAAGDATRVLTSSGARIFDAVKQYGAKNYAVTGDGLRITLDRGDVQTETAFGFYSQDEAGRPQLRVTFTCGSDRMVRWASLDSITGDALVHATQHVFGTGENYGARVVTASTKRSATAHLELVDAIEQRVHDEHVGRTVANVRRALRPYSKQKLHRALPLLDAWTARHVTRYLRAS